jgi:hypothetical protein
MSREPTRIALLVTGTTALLGVVLALGPVSPARILAGYVLVLATIAIVELLRALAAGSDGASHSPYERALSRRLEPPGRPPELVRVERELTLGTSSAGHLHSRLIPLLRDAAVARLGRDLTRERLGDEAWELLRPDRPEPEDRNAPGMSLRRLRSVVSTLERL